jgi:phage N-6-adenine-methyltransferase
MSALELVDDVDRRRDEADNAATPWRIVRALEVEFGPFDLDPCATAATAKAPRFFGVDVDGIRQEWAGRVFCNPPYSQKVRWLVKAYASARRGALVVCLLPARIESAWYREHVLGKAEVRMIPDRINFEGPGGRVVRPRDGCMVAIFRPLGAVRIGG